MSATRGPSRSLYVGLLVLCVALVAGLLLVQGGGAGAGGPAPTGVASTARLEPTGVLPQATVEGAEAAHTSESGLPTVPEADLPREAQDTLALIRSGGPFPYRQDDESFFNREGILPGRPRGYYREYTVQTRGSPDRGARRIVAGEDGDLYYTADHYDSFERIEEGR